jgi:hypothetical protein
MRNGRELCPTLHVTVAAAAWAPPDVTRNGKCAAHMSCISFSAAFGRLHRGARAIGDQFSPKVIIPNAMSPWEKNGASWRISNDES